ncbi:transglycosylase domain-containing protein [Oceanobacillus picturae]|uniref:transglycosylase domain-containing protein n=1 Tax=Oceanobacillus picturae TaxID=171693 RepID=UPI000E68B2D2|nr:transglycosylase domain-containing protein [Oceanobacillus picturae]RIU89695.1 penicillin-binding protein [Oceanobacillus picturae]
MNWKQRFHQYMEKLKSIWKSGKVQRSSRISYDVGWNVLLFFLIIGFIGMFFAGGVGAGYFASLVKDEPVLSYETMQQDIYNYEETSKLYFADDKYFGDVQSDLHREEVTLENISPVLLDAVIATEDENFEEHHGVVPKAILRAVLQEVTNSEVKTGGSTLTQQLIKNQILTNEVSFERKAKEILLALRLERFFEKDEILEAYLNIVPYGRNASGNNIAGVQTAAQGIFGVDAKNVNIAQAAYLAGLPQSPSAYTPFLNGGDLKDEDGLQRGINRMKTVLNRMLESSYITQEEYDESINYDIVADFKEASPSPVEKYPYLTFEVEKKATEVIMYQLAEKDGYTKEDLEKDSALKEDYEVKAERDLRKNGYNIHTTIDKDIYEAFQEVATNYDNYGPTVTVTETNSETGETEEVEQRVQTGGMLIENSTGRIISFVGGRGYDENNNINYISDNVVRSNGSTMKPLLDYAPAMEEGKVQPGTPVADVRKQIPGWPSGKPGNYGGGYHGIVSARTALQHSYNVPAADIYSRIMDINPAEKYLEKMGITSISEDLYGIASLSIGVAELTLEENINAFTTFGNNGKFADAYMIEKITNQDGDVVYEHKAEPVEVFSPQTTYLTIDMMRDVISSGTAGYLRPQLSNGSVDWAGKTGTSNNYHDAWFVATNPNVTFGTWIGYDDNRPINNASTNYSHRNLKLWAELINSAAAINPELVTPSETFKRPDGIVQRSYCAISGMLPSELCEKAGLVKSDLFNAKYVPTETDDSLVSGSSVIVNGKAVVAGANTPDEFVTGDGLMFSPEFLKRNGYDKLPDLTQLYPRTETEKWKRIGVPGAGAEIGDAIEDDGKDPSAPTSLSKSGSKLTWKKSGSNDVVGYRVYRATKAGGKFSLVGSTTETSYTIGNNNAIYHVKAVDYFGRESAASKEIMVGNTSEPEPETPDSNKETDNEKETADENNESKKEDKQQEESNNDQEEEKEENSQDEESSQDEENNQDDSEDEQ